MGCHTWCYKKVERSIQEARTIWMEHQTKWINEWSEITKNPQHKFRLSRDLNQDYCENCLRIYKRQLRMVEKGLCNFAVMNKQPEHSMYIQGKGFYVEEGTHNPFRIYGYPEDLLFSYDECINFISRYEKERSAFVELTQNGMALEKFWANNPNGMICFG